MRKKIIWTVNKHTRELHRSVKGEAHNAECNYNKIAKENLISFPTATAAIKAGNDVSAHCTTRHFRSRRNATKHRDLVAEGLGAETIEE